MARFSLKYSLNRDGGASACCSIPGNGGAATGKLPVNYTAEGLRAISVTGHRA
jgi:hypothetical protein